MYTAATILVLGLLVAVHLLAQDPDKLSAEGVDQLRVARASRTDDAYRVAEETFSSVLTSSPNHATQEFGFCKHMEAVVMAEPDAETVLTRRRNAALAARARKSPPDVTG